MPTDACQFFYECAGCETLLRPKPGDCSVFVHTGQSSVHPCRSNATAHVVSEPSRASLIVNEPRFQDITERISYLRGISERLAPAKAPPISLRESLQCGE